MGWFDGAVVVVPCTVADNTGPSLLGATAAVAAPLPQQAEPVERSRVATVAAVNFTNNLPECWKG